eukprot:2672077-Prymnesium_polylepis.1
MRHPERCVSGSTPVRRAVTTRLDSTFLTARRQRTGTITGEDTGPHPHNPSRPLRSQAVTPASGSPPRPQMPPLPAAGWICCLMTTDCASRATERVCE